MFRSSVRVVEAVCLERAQEEPCLGKAAEAVCLAKAAVETCLVTASVACLDKTPAAVAYLDRTPEVDVSGRQPKVGFLVRKVQVACLCLEEQALVAPLDRIRAVASSGIALEATFSGRVSAEGFLVAKFVEAAFLVLLLLRATVPSLVVLLLRAVVAACLVELLRAAWTCLNHALPAHISPAQSIMNVSPNSSNVFCSLTNPFVPGVVNLRTYLCMKVRFFSV